MPVTTVLFDLDGTLVPMDQDLFIGTYFKRIAAHLQPHGYDPEKLIKTIWYGTGAMIKNDGTCTNEQVFWEAAAQVYGEKILEDQPLFDAFYQTKFDSIREVCGFTPAAAETVRSLKQRGFHVALATNPVFPTLATEHRIRWAGLSPEDFELYTTYENICFSKPNPDYYRAILQKLGLSPDECLMVGNDVDDDMVAATLGMQVFLLTNCLINKKEADISPYPRGGFDELNAFLSAL